MEWFQTNGRGESLPSMDGNPYLCMILGHFWDRCKSGEIIRGSLGGINNGAELSRMGPVRVSSVRSGIFQVLRSGRWMCNEMQYAASLEAHTHTYIEVFDWPAWTWHHFTATIVARARIWATRIVLWINEYDVITIFHHGFFHWLTMCSFPDNKSRGLHR